MFTLTPASTIGKWGYDTYAKKYIPNINLYLNSCEQLLLKLKLKLIEKTENWQWQLVYKIKTFNIIFPQVIGENIKSISLFTTFVYATGNGRLLCKYVVSGLS